MLARALFAQGSAEVAVLREVLDNLSRLIGISNVRLRVAGFRAPRYVLLQAPATVTAVTCTEFHRFIGAAVEPESAASHGMHSHPSE